MNTLCEKRYISFVGACPKTAPSQVHMFLSKAHLYNLSRFRLGACKLNVNNVNLKHISGSIRFCNYCTNRNNISMEDEEHVIFGCPEYNTCRLEYPEFSIFQKTI